MSGQATFIPGPWKVAPDEFNRTSPGVDCYAFGSVVSENGWFIATVENAPREEANAHLIASAPAMYAVLTDLLALADIFPVKHPQQTETKERARAILKQARGES